MIQLVPLGSWCRTAHQTRTYAENRTGILAGTFPYDWMITSFDALRNTLNRDFDPNTILQPGRTSVSRFNSGVCENSGIIFHHAMGPNQLQKVAELAPGDKLPDSPESLSLMERSRNRFLHTHRRLDALKTQEGPLVFVRWQRSGHPDKAFPEVFEGETPDTLSSLIAAYLGHDDFYLGIVQTQIEGQAKDPVPNPIMTFEAEGRIISARLRERPGWNGDGTANFRGDEPSWTAFFDRAFETWGLLQPAESSRL